MLIKNLLNKNNISDNYTTTLITVDYDNSFITYYMLKSFLRLKDSGSIIICVLINKENQYIYLLEELTKTYKNINLIYNYHSRLLKNCDEHDNIEFGWGSYNHSLSLQYLIDNYVFTKNVLICDSDIIFKDIFDIAYFIDELNTYDIISVITDFKGQTSYIVEKLFKAESYRYIINNLNIYTYMIDNKFLTIYGRFDPFCIFFKTQLLKENTIIDDKSDIDILCMSSPNYMIDSQKTNFICCDTFGKLTYKLLSKNYKIKSSTLELYNAVTHFSGASSWKFITDKKSYYNDFVKQYCNLES